MASMGAGRCREKITRAVERHRRGTSGNSLPAPVPVAQEGITSWRRWQRPRRHPKRHSDAGLFYVSVSTDPTTGGVTASFCHGGDVGFGRAGALIGFAGPRVLEQTIRQKPPKGQRSEARSMASWIVERDELKQVLSIPGFIRPKRQAGRSFPGEKFGRSAKAGGTENRAKGRQGQKQRWREEDSATRGSASGIGYCAPEIRTVPKRDYLEELFEDFYELHGTGALGMILAFVKEELPDLRKARYGHCLQKERYEGKYILHHFGMCAPERSRR